MDPSLAKFIDPVRELKPSLKGGMSLAPTLKLALTPVQYL
jgi:hypothetical protein